MEPFLIAGGTTALGIIGTLIMSWKKDIERRQVSQQHEMNDIKTNYINRFEDVKDTINITEKNILQEISKINIMIASNPNKKLRK